MGLIRTIRKIIRMPIFASILLFLAAILAAVVANSPLSEYYKDLLNLKISFNLGDFNLFTHMKHDITVLEFINDGLMTLFFLMVGLEIKREVLAGELSTVRKAMLPVISAIGGMIIPVLIYALFNHPGTEVGRGLAIPMATDIAFSLGVLSLLGSRVPLALKIFLTAFAVVDDIGGILIIAIFYCDHISIAYLGIAAVLFLIVYLGCKYYTRSTIFIAIMGVAIWYMFMQSGIHSTISGVILAFIIPATPLISSRRYVFKVNNAIGHFEYSHEKKPVLDDNQMYYIGAIEKAKVKVMSPMQSIEHALHPFVNYIVLPLFAFVNAGVKFSGGNEIIGSVSMGVALGLILGKFLGIFSFTWIAIKSKIVSMPSGMNWRNLAGVSLLGGIGFTVSLFVANLSFHVSNHEHADMLNQAKFGVILGSIIAGVTGYLILHYVLTHPKDEKEKSLKRA